jgi:prephenate dehydrogenase
MMAYVQGLSHYIARVMDEMNIPETELSTLAYEDLIDMKRVQGGDSWELFYSIMEENPYTHKVNRDFKKACLALDKKLNK